MREIAAAAGGGAPAEPTTLDATNGSEAQDEPWPAGAPRRRWPRAALTGAGVALVLAVQCSAHGACEMQCGSASQTCDKAKLSCGTNTCKASCSGQSKPQLVCDPTSSCPCEGC